MKHEHQLLVRGLFLLPAVWSDPHLCCVCDTLQQDSFPDFHSMSHWQVRKAARGGMLFLRWWGTKGLLSVTSASWSSVVVLNNRTINEDERCVTLWPLSPSLYLSHPPEHMVSRLDVSWQLTSHYKKSVIHCIISLISQPNCLERDLEQCEESWHWLLWKCEFVKQAIWCRLIQEK